MAVLDDEELEEKVAGDQGSEKGEQKKTVLSYQERQGKEKGLCIRLVNFGTL